MLALTFWLKIGAALVAPVAPVVPALIRDYDEEEERKKNEQSRNFHVLFFDLDIG